MRKIIIVLLLILVACDDKSTVSKRQQLYRQLPDRVICVVDYGEYMVNPDSPEEVACAKYPDFGLVVECKLLFISDHGNPCFEVTIQKFDKWKTQ